ncbi:hypothetical protein B5807_11402 [Epicoccum nigrum]|uniref:Uncharacterized protein n=1 Tax=Epicoccum nigrum TaxID=105696 RepID=A0A1Y2LIU8_EPING|nr:hypothetical protein B5807_11402 [Epicoccum nigrum]
MPTKRCSEEIDAVEEFPSPHPATNKRFKINRATRSELPGELYNCIYECCLALEAESSHYIIHRSSDDKLNLDSGSASNFSSSFWSLTQVNREICGDFKSWLLDTHRVETPLATLDEYVDVFHPVDEQSGTYTGWIKPIPPLLCGIPLPTRGMDISEAMKHRRFDSTCFVDLEKQHDLDPMCNTLCALHHEKAWQGYCAQTFNIQSISLTPYQNGVWDGMHKVPCRVSKPGVDHDALLKIKCGPSFTLDGQQRTPEQQMRCFAHWFYYEAEPDLCQSVKVLVSVPGYKTMWTVLEPGYCYATWERFGDEREAVFRTHWKVKSKVTLEDSKEVKAVMDRGWYTESYE